MKNVVFLLMLSVMLVRCDSADEIIVNIPEATGCKVLKYQKITRNDAHVGYGTELVYENGRVTKRLNYGNNISSSAGGGNFGLISTDLIFYNEKNQVTKIQYRTAPFNTYDLFYYNANNNNPVKRERIRISEEGYFTKWVENITYNDSGQILKTVYTYDNVENIPAFDENTTTNYTYDSAGNLSQVVEIAVNMTTTLTTTTVFSDYDSHKNPFRTIAVPFIENRHVQFSANNYTKIERESHYGTEWPSHFTSQFSLEYNEFDYPTIAEYQCQ